MKFTALLFTFVAFSVFKFLVLTNGYSEDPPEMPTLTFPNLDLLDVSFSSDTTCSDNSWLWWTGLGTIYCIGEAVVVNAADVAAAISNLFLAAYWVILVVFKVGQFIGALLILMGTLIFTGLDGAPIWLNVIVFTPFAIMFGITIYRLFRSGASED